ncbi:MAG: PorT family protein [Bacteroidaceae bacterium]|nr:PorT family protein [Bacteroidaceae bacterium]
MKKIISTLFVAVALMFTGVQSIHAQFSWGIKGGLNLQKADFENARNNVKPENFTGYFIGPMAEFTIPVIGLGLDGALLYSQSGLSYSVEDGFGIDETLKSHSIEVPINLKYSLGLGKLASIFAAAGPQFAFALSQDEWKSDLENYKSKPFKKSQLSLNLGVGVKLLGHLQAGVAYNIPLGDTVEFEDYDYDSLDEYDVLKTLSTAENKTWKLHVAYTF